MRQLLRAECLGGPLSAGPSQSIIQRVTVTTQYGRRSNFFFFISYDLLRSHRLPQWFHNVRFVDVQFVPDYDEHYWTLLDFQGISLTLRHWCLKLKSQTGGCIEWHRWICYTGCYLLRTSMIYNIMRWFQREMRTRLQFFLFRYGHHGNPSNNLQLAKRHFGLYCGKLIVGLAILAKSEILWTHPCGLVD